MSLSDIYISNLDDEVTNKMLKLGR